MAKKKEEEVNAFWERLGIPLCSIPEFREAVILGIETQHPVCGIGEAGIGKTQIMKQIADDLKMDCEFFYLAHVEREDIGGIPYPGKDGQSYRFLCESSILEIIKNERPTLLVLDEWNRGEKPVMSAAFTMMESRRFGSYTLPDHVHIMACMNPSQGAYAVNEAEKDPAFRRRLCFLGVQANIDAWVNYAQGRGEFHPLVVEFVRKKPAYLNDTQTRDAGKIYASPASWEKISNTMKVMDAKKMDYVHKHRRLFYLKCAGHIGTGVTEHFQKFLEDTTSAIDPYDVIKRYTKQRKARDAIMRHINSGRNDIVMELADSVAHTLVGDEPNPDTVGRHVAAFCKDLPEDGLIAFLTKLKKYAKSMNKDDEDGYYQQFNEVLNEEDDYVEAIQQNDDTVEKIRKELSQI